MKRISSLRIKSVRKPDKLVARNGQHIETAIYRIKAGSTLSQPDSGGMQQPLLFAVGDTGCCATEVGVSSISYFHKHPGLLVAHHQIELAAAQRDIGCHEDQAGALKIIPGLSLIAGSRHSLVQEAGTSCP